MKNSPLIFNSSLICTERLFTRGTTEAYSIIRSEFVSVVPRVYKNLLFLFLLGTALGGQAQSVLITPSKTSYSDSVVVEKSLIVESGNVGIGTSSPEEKLHIVGSTIIEEGRLTFKGTGSSIYIGDEAGINSSTNDRINTFIGFGAGKNNTIGFSNVYIGSNSGNENEEGDSNVAIGEAALAQSKTSANVAIGKFALGQNINGRENFALGNYAGFASNGNQNIFLGSGNGESAVGSRNVFIGNEVGVGSMGSDRLKIHNSNSTTPLIDGDFANKALKINGTFEATGSVALAVKTAQEAGSDHPNHTASIWIYTLSIGDINLPAPNTCPNRTYTIVNKTGGNLTISSYLDMTNTANTSISAASSITIVSDGTDWQQMK
jgi:hypothetical protein